MYIEINFTIVVVIRKIVQYSWHKSKNIIKKRKAAANFFIFLHFIYLYIYISSVKTVRKDERRYYEDLMLYSREHLMLYPYHLSDVIVKGLRITPFMYYINMMQDIMVQEKSYDSLPNFTAADCEFLFCCF